MTRDLLEKGRHVLAAQPFSQLLGVQLTAYTPGKARMEVELRSDLLQHHGFAHGGVLGSLADMALTFGGGSHYADRQVLTSEWKINYLRPGVGTRLVAEAQSLAAGKTQAVCTCQIFAVVGSERKLCAVAQGTIAVLGAT